MYFNSHKMPWQNDYLKTGRVVKPDNKSKLNLNLLFLFLSLGPGIYVETT